MTQADIVTQGRPVISTGRPGARRHNWSWLGILPFFGYLAIFFLLPMGVIVFEAFRSTDASTQITSFTGGNVSASLRGAYLASIKHSVELAAVTAVVSALLGLVLAWAVVSGSGTFRRLVSSAAAVCANFGGLPLAFLFIAMIGNAGVLTRLLSSLGISLADDLHFHLYTLTGVELVYLYFLIPLMVLVITPALEGLKPQWKEASENLGASGWHYWRYVAGPVLAPNIAGAVALLFCSSFSAYATAYALTNGSLSITPLSISSALSGNVQVGAQNLGDALALDMIIIVVPLTLLYQFMQRRTTKWLQ